MKLDRCTSCKAIHQHPEWRYRCEGCNSEVCLEGTRDGHQFNRPRMKVHVASIVDKKALRVTFRFCGRFWQVDDVPVEVVEVPMSGGVLPTD